MFKDAKSAVISIAAIILVIALGIVGIDRNNVNRLTKTGKKITSYKEDAYTLIDERIELSSMVGRILVEEGSTIPSARWCGSGTARRMWRR